MIEAIRIAITNVAARGRRVREGVAAQIDKIRTPIHRTHIFKAQHFAQHRRRILANPCRRAAADHKHRAFFAHRQAAVNRVIHLEASDSQQTVRRAWHDPRAPCRRCEVRPVAFHEDAEDGHARRHRAARDCRVGEAVGGWQRAANVGGNRAAGAA